MQEVDIVQIDDNLDLDYSNYDQEGDHPSTGLFYSKSGYMRIRTAPPRPLTDIEQFKRTQEFLLLEYAVLCSQNLIQNSLQKYDLDSIEGSKACKAFLGVIEKLCLKMQVKTINRNYRQNFSKAYKNLYVEGELCYLNEILDSAQEAFPHLWVNGDKYVFSNEVLQGGQQLLKKFNQLQVMLRTMYTQICQDSIQVNQLKEELLNQLSLFDKTWTDFEQLYIIELMVIEKDARRYIEKAIQIEKELYSLEIREKIKGRKFIVNADITNLKRKLCEIIQKINSVANTQGKGRDDLQFEILEESEGILRRITQEQSQAVRILAQNIKNSFEKLRQLFRKYEQNMEIVDPQLKNNADLVEILLEYEVNWEKGNTYFLDHQRCVYLIHFSHIIETTAQKHKKFSEQIECRDSDVFLIIPYLLILKCLNNEDKNICFFLLPQLKEPKGNNINLMFEDLKQEFEQWKKGHSKMYEFYNILEKVLLDIQLSLTESMIVKQNAIENIVHKIKQLSIQLQRQNTVEWNGFLHAALCYSN